MGKSIQLKRQVTIKTVVTDVFRQKASSEMTEELQMIDNQLTQLEAQYQHSIRQLEQLAQQGQDVQRQLSQLNADAQQKRNQLASVKMQVSTQMANLEKVENGQFVVTGMLENLVDVTEGDNLYEKLANAEMIVEDGVVKTISG